MYIGTPPRTSLSAGTRDARRHDRNKGPETLEHTSKQESWGSSPPPHGEKEASVPACAPLLNGIARARLLPCDA